MSRNPIHSHWHIELGDEFSRRTTDDGFVIFEMPSRRVWGVAYEMGDASPELVLAECLNTDKGTPSQFPFRNDPLLQGHSQLSRRDETYVLDTSTATRGEVANLRFEFEIAADVDWALSAWRSIAHSPPDWIQICISSEASLFQLRQALERDIGIDDALDELQQRKELAQAGSMLIRALSDESPTVRQAASYALGQLEGSPAAVPALLSKLEDFVPLVRIRAAEALYHLGVSVERIVPVLIAVLEDGDGVPLPEGEARIQGPCGYLCVPDRYYAAMVLEEIGPDVAEMARSALRNSLYDESGCVRLMSAKALVTQGESPEAVVPALLEALNSKKMSKRELVRVAEALIELGQPVAVVLPVVIDAIQESEWGARAEAMYLLQEIGTSAQLAVVAVTRATEDDDENVRELAKETLRCIAAPE